MPEINQYYDDTIIAEGAKFVKTVRAKCGKLGKAGVEDIIRFGISIKVLRQFGAFQ